MHNEVGKMFFLDGVVTNISHAKDSSVGGELSSVQSFNICAPRPLPPIAEMKGLHLMEDVEKYFAS